MGTGVSRVLKSALVFGLVTGVWVQDSARARPRKAEAASQGSGGRSGKSPLDQIRDYQVGLPRETAPSTPAPSLAEMVNPFPAKQAGRLNGSVYWFHRNDNLDARNFFDPGGKPLPEYKRNEFGASLGARVGDKIQLFGSLQSLRIIQGSTLLSHVPAPEMKQGDFSSLEAPIVDPVTGEPFPGNQIPRSRLHPVARNLFRVIPDPNSPDPDRNFVNNQPRVTNRDTYLFRFDYAGDDDAKSYLQYSLTDGDGKMVHPLPAFGWNRTLRSQSVSLSHNRTLGTRWVTEGSIGYNRYLSLSVSPNSGQVGLLDSVGISGLAAPDALTEGYPDFEVTGYASFGDSSSPYKWLSNRYSGSFSATTALGDHTLTMGTSLTQRQVYDTHIEGRGRGEFEFSGFYTGDGFADFVLGLPSVASRTVGSDRTDLRRNQWQAYIRDRWRLSPILAVTGGVAYHYASPYRSNSDTISGFFPLLFEPPASGRIIVADSFEARALGLERAGRGGLVFPDRNDWAPRIGLSYRPFKTNRLVFRASYSLYYSVVGSSSFSRYLGKNYPFYYTETAQSPVDSPDLDLANPFENVAPPELVVRGIETGLRTPYVQAWTLTLENDFQEVWQLRASYYGNKRTGWSRVLPGNIPLPAPGPIQSRRPNPDFGRFRILTGASSGSSHRMDLSAERRLSDGMSLRSGFTLHRSLDDRYRREPSNPRNLKAERASARGVPIRQFSLNYIIDLPPGRERTLGSEGRSPLLQLVDGWRLSGITRIQGGTPFSVYVAGDGNNDGLGGDRADRISLTPGDRFESSVDMWFPVDDFAEPAPYSFGNSGRNILRRPGYHAWDISLIKQTRLVNGDLVELRVELFNAFNQVNFRQPNAVVGTSLFGKIFGAHRSREIEVALKYSF